MPEHGKQHKARNKSASRPSEGECEADGSFVFEALEAWKDFHGSLRQFYENGELCDVTLKVSMGTGTESVQPGARTAQYHARVCSVLEELSESFVETRRPQSGSPKGFPHRKLKS